MKKITFSAFLVFILLSISSIAFSFAQYVGAAFNNFKGLLGEEIVAQFYEETGGWKIEPKSQPQGIDVLVRKGYKEVIITEVKTGNAKLSNINTGAMEMSEEWLKNNAYDKISNEKLRELLKNGKIKIRKRLVRINFEHDKLIIEYSSIEDIDPKNVKINSKTIYGTGEQKIEVKFPPGENDPEVVKKWYKAYKRALDKVFNDKKSVEYLRNALKRLGIEDKEINKTINNAIKALGKGNIVEANEIIEKAILSDDVKELLQKRPALKKVIFKNLEELNKLRREMDKFKKGTNEYKKAEQEYKKKLAKIKNTITWSEAFTTGFQLALLRNLSGFAEVYQGDKDIKELVKDITIDTVGYGVSVKVVNAVVVKVGEKFAVMSWLPETSMKIGAQAMVAMFVFDTVKIGYSYLIGDISQEKFIETLKFSSTEALISTISFAAANAIIGIVPGVGPVLLGLQIPSIGLSIAISTGIHYTINYFEKEREYMTVDEIEDIFHINLRTWFSPWNPPEHDSPWDPPEHESPWDAPEHESPWDQPGHNSPWGIVPQDIKEKDLC